MSRGHEDMNIANFPPLLT